MTDCRSCGPPDDRPFCPGSDKPAAPGAGTRYGYCADCMEPFVLCNGNVPGHRVPDARVVELLALATTDPDTGEDTGHLGTPCSPYGRTGADCAPWAVAVALIHEHANGTDPADMLDEAMGYAVNGSDSVVSLVADYWYALPPALQEVLDGADALVEYRAESEADEDDDEEGFVPFPGQLSMTMEGF